MRVNFEIAKMLKSKNINFTSDKFFDINGNLKSTKMGMHNNPNNYYNCYSAPKIKDVLEYLIVEYNLDIQYIYDVSNDTYNVCITYIADDTGEFETIEPESLKELELKSDVYLKGIEYAFENLINI